ncbi:MAG: MFS transporter, partial [Sandaracinaceae bacterium]|nr:MFS transporter [Sandaracinaceae bacterium]
ATWGIAQIFTGAWSDRVGRKWLIASGMWVQALGIVVIVLSSAFAPFATGAALLGVGTAMVYPTLLTAAERACELPHGAVVVTVCGKGGGRSERAAEHLRASGFASARSLCGGAQAWMQLAAQGA